MSKFSPHSCLFAEMESEDETPLEDLEPPPLSDRAREKIKKQRKRLAEAWKSTPNAEAKYGRILHDNERSTPLIHVRTARCLASFAAQGEKICMLHSVR